MVYRTSLTIRIVPGEDEEPERFLVSFLMQYAFIDNQISTKREQMSEQNSDQCHNVIFH